MKRTVHTLVALGFGLASIGCYTTNLDKHWDSARQEVLERMVVNPDAGQDDSTVPLDGKSTEQALEKLRAKPEPSKSGRGSTTLIRLGD